MSHRPSNWSDRADGETAIVEVAREYLGFIGVVVILVAGLLATISSANASILSASRALYGLIVIIVSHYRLDRKTERGRDGKSSQ